ncbi:MAG: ATP-binding cassette domain-containing protein, partial [Pseudomonadota bacterium]|nr:ATP-binding cassette domain-containing protein [Pseudomonadota bacterium]
MLSIRDLHAYYGKSHVLQGVDLEVRGGEVVALLGRNGVGRSTLAKAVMGVVGAGGATHVRGPPIAGGPHPRHARRGRRDNPQ